MSETIPITVPPSAPSEPTAPSPAAPAGTLPDTASGEVENGVPAVDAVTLAPPEGAAPDVSRTTGEASTGSDSGAGAAPGAPPGTDKVSLGPDPLIAGAKSDGEELEAIICIPGIGESVGTSFMAVAERIATAMDNCATTGEAWFTVATRDAKTRSGVKLQSAAILRHDKPDDAKGREVLHLYEYDYRPRLLSGLEKRPPAMQAVAMAWTLLFNFPSVWLAWVGRRGKGWVHKLQVFYGTGLFFGIFLYLVLLVFAGADATGLKEPPSEQPGARNETPSGTPATGQGGGAATARTPGATPAVAGQVRTAAVRSSERPATPVAGGTASRAGAGAWIVRAWTNVKGFPGRGWSWVENAAGVVWGWVKAVGAWLDRSLSKVATVVIVIPLFGMFVRFNLRQVLETAAPKLASAAAYLGAGRSRAEIIGELAQVINHLDENGVPGKRYGKVHVAAYSFGSIVAIDSLFQHETAINPRLRRIDTLVTIGCPYDFVRTYWPSYFKDRQAAVATDRPTWINVYNPLDVLGSNFIDEPGVRERRRYRAADAAVRAKLREEWDGTLGRGVELGDGSACVRPAFKDNVAFGQGRNGTAGFWDWARFVGFRAHGMYWSRESATAITCFEPVVTRLFEKSEAKILA